MTDVPAPRSLGSSYVLEHRIGAGAQGEVWSGRRVDSGEVLAFKVLRAELVDTPGVVEGFIKERSTLMRVRSPFVVTIRDVVIEGSTFAIVMDYVGGGDLRALVRERGSLRPGDLAGLGAGVAQGLAAVHEAGVVHRDVKPANILLEPVGVPQGGPGAASAFPVRLPGGSWARPRVADFGVARICDTIAAAHATGAVGTPLYMAPEILSSQPPTAAADVYSLGVVLYQMACGTPPFVGQAPQLLAQHARRDPGRPQGIPDPLWELVVLMLSKQPAARPGAEEVARRLTVMRSRLEDLPAAPVLAQPPRSSVSPVPYEWDAERDPGRSAGAGAGEAGPVQEATVAVTASPTLPLARQTQPPGASPGSSSDSCAARWPGAAPGGPDGTLALPLAGASETAPYGPGGVGSRSSRAGGTPGRSADGADGADGATLSAYGYAGGFLGGPPVAGAPGGGRSSSSRSSGRSRWRLVPVVIVVVLVLAVGAAGTAVTWWWLARETVTAGPGWLFSVPAGDGVSEDLRVSGVSEGVNSPGGDLYAARSDGAWSLYDLAGSGGAAVWTGTCSTTAVFWNDDSLLCQSPSSSILVHRDGTTSQPPGPSSFEWVGATSARTILVEERGRGDLVAMTPEGSVAWRLHGDYREGLVRNGYVLTHDSGLGETQVVSVSSGRVLASVREEEPDFPEEDTDLPPESPTGQADLASRYPGGFNITTGEEAFSRVTENGVTIYDSDGTEARTLEGTYSPQGVSVLSAPLDAQSLAEAYTTSAQSSSARYAFGPDEPVETVVSTSDCSVTADGTRLEVPARSPGEACFINVLGALRGEALLVQVGQPSTSTRETGDAVVAYSLSDGTALWQVRGTMVGLAPPRSGEADGRLLVAQTGSSRVDLAVVSVVGS
ncbi:serine/threonine-protein kinase [Actinomyces wuliandei]|uniref:serine/threonine-protein kinase n=1 Tax=Actinomyces wuliandei TaxID=2057743 RepID=UPI000FDB5206|nr:serine/threonine-protein kinase [Actinomyces wuliandei]